MAFRDLAYVHCPRNRKLRSGSRRNFAAEVRVTRRGSGPLNTASVPMAKTTQDLNKALVLEAFDTLFNQRDYEATERYWSPDYIQHSAHITPGRESLFNLVRSAPAMLKYQPGVIVAENDYVIVHGRFSGNGRPRNWVAADILRVPGGVLAEHWDVQGEATAGVSQSGLAMSGTGFASDTAPTPTNQNP